MWRFFVCCVLQLVGCVCVRWERRAHNKREIYGECEI